MQSTIAGKVKILKLAGFEQRKFINLPEHLFWARESMEKRGYFVRLAARVVVDMPKIGSGYTPGRSL